MGNGEEDTIKIKANEMQKCSNLHSLEDKIRDTSVQPLTGDVQIFPSIFGGLARHKDVPSPHPIYPIFLKST